MPKQNIFLTELLPKKGITPDNFFNKLSFSRATFYRCTKSNTLGTTDFNINQIEEIADALSMTYSECKEYFGIVPASIVDHSVQRNNIIQDIFFSSSPLDGTNTNSEFEFYDEVKEYNEEGKEQKKIKNKYSLSILSVMDTAEQIVRSLWREESNPDFFYHYKLTIKIYNCSNLQICSLLARLFYSIEKKFYDGNRSFRLKVVHYIPNYNGKSTDELSNYLELLKQTLPLHAFCCEYEQILRPLSARAWSNGNDMCIIKYSRLCVPSKSTIESERSKPSGKRDQVYEHFIIKFATEFDSLHAFITRLGEPLYIYKFFTCDTRLLTQSEESSVSALKSSRQTLKNLSTNPSIFVTINFCFDSFNPKHWRQLLTNIKNDTNAMSYLKKIFFLEPAVFNNSYSSIDPIENLLSGIETRYNTKCQNKCINILWEEGLSEFVSTKMITDIQMYDYPNIQFHSETIIEILREVLDSIRNLSQPGKQKFYILKHNSHGDFRAWYIITKNFGVRMGADKSFTKNITSTCHPNKEVANILYQYLSDEIAKRNIKHSTTISQYSSDIQFMSDEEAVNYIESLITSITKSGM